MERKQCQLVEEARQKEGQTDDGQRRVGKAPGRCGQDGQIGRVLGGHDVRQTEQGYGGGGRTEEDIFDAGFGGPPVLAPEGNQSIQGVGGQLQSQI